MQRTFSELYRAEAYPAMSYPSADPAVNVGVARQAGLDTPDPARARMLEIACGTGHHLISLASRWPEANCEGVEVSRRAISRAERLARQAGMENGKCHVGTVMDRVLERVCVNTTVHYLAVGRVELTSEMPLS